jgi:hypothetical protein
MQQYGNIWGMGQQGELGASCRLKGGSIPQMYGRWTGCQPIQYCSGVSCQFQCSKLLQRCQLSVGGPKLKQSCGNILSFVVGMLWLRRSVA